VIKKADEQILKYKKNLTIEIQGMWNVKTRVISTSKRCNWNYIAIIQKIPEKQAGKAESQIHSALTGTAHILRIVII